MKKSLLERIDLYLTEKGKVTKWSQKVKVKFHPAPGTFKKGSPDQIIAELGKDGADNATIMKRLNFFLNRGGKGVTPEIRKKVEQAKKMLSSKKGNK
jgi:predicted PP-loop superfamily ATPase